MGSISFLTTDLKRGAWQAKRIVAARVLEVSAFPLPGRPEGLAFLRVRVERVFRGGGIDVGAELRVFSGLQWFRHSHAELLRLGVESYLEQHYSGGLPHEEIRPGQRILLFLDDQQAPAELPPDAVFLSFEGGWDRGERETELEAALRDGPYGDFHHLLKISKERPVRLPSDLVVAFLGHSHKRPMVGGPRKEWVDLELSLDGKREAIALAHHVDPDGRETWEHRDWNGYKIEAHGMTTEEATIVVRKL